MPANGASVADWAGPGYANAMTIAAIDLSVALDLQPHPEGGFYRETYAAEIKVVAEHGVRAAATAILFLLTAESPSRFHRLLSDELWLYHGGAPVELVSLQPDGSSETALLAGAGNVLRSELITPQAIVPAGAWQAARVLPGDGVDWALLTCIVTPGFDFDDFELGERRSLLAAYPSQAEAIRRFT
jgi:predicted cupin superfamily sugar epimerase